MKSTYKEFRERAWAMLEGKWWQMAVVMLVFLAVSMVPSMLGFPMGKWSWTTLVLTLLLCPMTYALKAGFLRMDRGGEAIKAGELFDIYKTNFAGSFAVVFLTILFTFLWMLLFFIPGVIMSYAYSMAIYIAADHPELTPMECIKRSKELMKGHKWNLFVLDLTFIGWMLLAMLTGGILTLFVAPYQEMARAEFYREIIAEGQPEEITADAAVAAEAE